MLIVILTILFAFLEPGACIEAVAAPAKLDSLTILINNDLLGPASPNADSGVILLSNRSLSSAVTACSALKENLWAPEYGTASIQANLDYLVYEGKFPANQLFWIQPSERRLQYYRAISASGNISIVSPSSRLPALCTQTAPFSNGTYTDTNSRYQVTVHSNNDYITGFRDRHTFNFRGIRVANQPARFAHATPYVGKGTKVSALQFGNWCPQIYNGAPVGSEDCLNLNIWTPYLPADGDKALKKDLKPVMVSIFGGGFQTGHPNIPANDGGGLASRGDVVVVAINYRLGSFGLLPLNDGANNGNYGISDQALALDWIRANIADFGGDPDRITLFGESAGGASVRVQVASPKSAGKFVGAIAQSFGQAGTTYAPFLTINDGISKFAAPTLAAFNCTNATSQVDCLRAVPTDKLTSFATQASNLVVDGVYVTAPLLPTTLPKGVHFMSGTTRDDGAAFLPAYPTTDNLTAWLEAGNVSFVGASGLFPLPSGNNATLAIFNVTNRMLTDYTFLCPSQTVLKQFATSSDAGIYGYVFNRAYQPASWDPWNGLCRPPATIAHPNGDPSQEYFKCHAGEMYYTFGTLAREGQHFRDDADLPFMQYIVDAWTSFGRTYDPNPDPALLKARRYDNTAKELARSGKWLPIEGDYTMRALDWPTSQVGVAEAAQCGVVGWPGL